MALNIKNAEARRLAQELAKSTGRSITQVVIEALREAHSKNQRKSQAQIESIVSQLDAITEHYAHLPTLDERPAEEILGYDENGLPNQWSSILPRSLQFFGVKPKLTPSN